jgi:predicted metal-dependent hydrolase
MSTDACLELPPSGLVRGIEDFNRGEFHKCHDTLEQLWMAERRPVRALYKDILQIGVAFYHLEKGRQRPAITLLERATGSLRAFAPQCQGVNVAGLLSEAARCLDEVKRLRADRVNDFDWSLVPNIEIARSEGKTK